MNEEFIYVVMAGIRSYASYYKIPFTDDDFARIESLLDYQAVTALERADGDELAWIGEGQAEARRETYGY